MTDMCNYNNRLLIILEEIMKSFERMKERLKICFFEGKNLEDFIGREESLNKDVNLGKIHSTILGFSP